LPVVFLSRAHHPPRKFEQSVTELVSLHDARNRLCKPEGAERIQQEAKGEGVAIHKYDDVLDPSLDDKFLTALIKDQLPFGVTASDEGLALLLTELRDRLDARR
jgi:hypothetical protein